MANDTDLPQSQTDGPDAGFEPDSLHETSPSPPRFGRLALCMAAAGALTLGVVGTVAYGVWFNHDQQAYAEAIAGARQALGVPATAAETGTPTETPAKPISVPAVAAPTSGAPAKMTSTSIQTASMPAATEAALVSDGEEGSKQAVWTGQVVRTPAALSPATLAGATAVTPMTPASSLRSTRRATNSADPAAPPSATGHSGKDARSGQQERHAAAANARHRGNLFARMSLFFRRVSYRQHDSGRQQQDIYSHP